MKDPNLFRCFEFCSVKDCPEHNRIHRYSRRLGWFSFRFLTPDWLANKMKELENPKTAYTKQIFNFFQRYFPDVKIYPGHIGENYRFSVNRILPRLTHICCHRLLIKLILVFSKSFGAKRCLLPRRNLFDTARRRLSSSSDRR